MKRNQTPILWLFICAILWSLVAACCLDSPDESTARSRSAAFNASTLPFEDEKDNATGGPVVKATPGVSYIYVTGDVNQPGRELYTGHATVMSAIAAAGSFNNFAARRRVQLTRKDGNIYIEDCNKALKDPSLDLEVLPNDKIFVDKLTLIELARGKS